MLEIEKRTMVTLRNVVCGACQIIVRKYKDPKRDVTMDVVYCHHQKKELARIACLLFLRYLLSSGIFPPSRHYEQVRKYFVCMKTNRKGEYVAPEEEVEASRRNKVV